MNILYIMLFLTFVLFFLYVYTSINKKGRFKTIKKLLSYYLKSFIILTMLLYAIWFYFLLTSSSYHDALEKKYLFLVNEAKQSENVLRDEHLISDIFHYNAELENGIKNYKHPWTGFIFPTDVSDLPHIYLDEIIQLK